MFDQHFLGIRFLLCRSDPSLRTNRTAKAKVGAFKKQMKLIEADNDWSLESLAEVVRVCTKMYGGIGGTGS